MTERDRQYIIFENLNDILLELTDQQVIRTTPIIVYFDFKENEVTNFKCYKIRNNEKFVLNDLSASLTSELNNNKEENNKECSVFSSLLKETPKILYSEFVKMLLKDIV